MKTPLEAKSCGWAENIISPAGTINSSAATDQVKRCRARSVTAMFFDKPSTLRSNITTEPTNTANPMM
ncbi:hypothetical protein D9M69_706260 [compost metagenome]